MRHSTEHLHLSIHLHDWEQTGPEDDRASVLLWPAGVEALGMLHHLEAHAVEWVEARGDEEGRLQILSETAEAVFNAVGSQDPWQTVLIEGREYVLILTPYDQ